MLAREGNGQRKVLNGSICVNPHHHAPLDYDALLLPLARTLAALDYTADAVVWRVLQSLGWTGTALSAAPDAATGAAAFDLLCQRVRQLGACMRACLSVAGRRC